MLPLMMTGQKQPLPAAQVHRAEHDTTSVPARDPYPGWFSTPTPVGPQRRKEKQIGLVFHQQHAAWRQSPDSAANSPFFSRARDRALTRSGAASTHNPVGSAHGVSCDPRTGNRGTFPKDPAAAAPSSSRHGNRVPRETASTSYGAIANIPPSTSEVVLHGRHPATTRDRKTHGIVRSSDRYWGGSHARYAKSPSRIAPDRIPKPRAFVDTIERRANSSVAFPIDDAHETTIPMSSLKHPQRPGRARMRPRIGV